MPQGDLTPRLWYAVEVFRDGIVDRQLPILGQEHDAGGKELFAHRADLEDGLWRDRNTVLQVGHAIALRLDLLSIADDGE